MSPVTHSTAVAGRLESFLTASPGDREARFLRLTEAVWHNGTLTDLAPPAVPELIAPLARAAKDRAAGNSSDDTVLGDLAILLGLLAEAELPRTDGAVFAAVRARLDVYLALLARQGRRQEALPAGAGPPALTLALLYLVAHFADDRDRIRAVTGGLVLPAEDSSRLDRCLRPFGEGDVVLGRVWPSPAEWALTAAERAADQQWIRALEPAQAIATWDSDTRMVLGYSGAKAYWAQRHGRPVVVRDASRHAGDPVATDGPDDVFGPHAGLFRCSACRGQLDVGRDGARCTTCGTRFSVKRNILDLTGAAEPERDDPDDVLKNAAAMDGIGRYYETVLRPGFLRLMGTNWGGTVTPLTEDAYLAEHIRPADGPVLDLAAGAGRWTAVLCERFGAERVIALDLADAMLAWLRGRLPGVAAVQASALSLPFDDASIGAVNCWNALQTMPDPAEVIAEVGRVLRPGGTFTFLTFSRSRDPILRYYQFSFRGPGMPSGMPLFDLAELRDALDAAGLEIRAEWTPGTFVIITAQRPV